MTDRDRPTGGPSSRRFYTNAACYQEGEYWTLVFGGMLCRLRNARGLHYLAHLLRHPGKKFAASDLLKIGTAPAARRRAGEPAKADAERNRVLVTKQIRAIVNKIRGHHPSLAHHLDTCIKTGAQCVYLSDPSQPIHWERE